MRRCLLFTLALALFPSLAHAQLDPFASATTSTAPNPLTDPTANPAASVLYDLEARFAADVATGGGPAFAHWFADDAVELANGKPAALGHRAIAAFATWDPKTYQLTWTPQGAQLGPSGDTGFTWGTYDAHSHDHSGQPVALHGRYITFWKKVTGQWKVALDASADDAPAVDCCALPKP
jgi:ketosteroid isomerase-like protein